ncbi:MAG: hypothetical protein QME52_05545 [Bacteroidota bacterium]|nr:hypothetical protein [Bacteroidota bacterium]
MKQKRFFHIVAFWLMFVSTNSIAQEQPFIFTLYGGLFFPSNAKFKQISQSSSDLIWGGGICLPLKPALFITGDISYFRMKALVDAQLDSLIVLNESFIHVGILNKQPLAAKFSLRLASGLSYSTVNLKLSSAQTSERTIDAEKRLGYYFGIGIEQPLDVEYRTAMFADVLYDYRRSENKEIYGDYGGLRIVLGVHLFLF